ncbi:MAG: hypothetical protein F6K32_01070 [Desertifilum sp. SIO1I2]|nr:hypothetical protein [Desertifilum sp. SIO1I2]
MIQCPVCQTEYHEDVPKLCKTCGWDLTPDPLPKQVLDALERQERIRLAWARNVWARAKEIAMRVQLQGKMGEMQAQLEEATRERSRLESQIVQVFSQVEQITPESFQTLLADVFPGKERLSQIQTQLRQTQQQLAERTHELELAQTQIGSDGLDLLISALEDPLSQIQRIAYLLLQRSAAPKAIEAVQAFQLQSYKLFTNVYTGEATDAFRAIAISPDNQIIAAGNNDKTIKLWDLATGKLQQTLSGHEGAVLSIAISPDGETLASGSSDKTIKLWNLTTGELLSTLAGYAGEVWGIAFSPDSHTIAGGSNDKTIKLWKWQTGELISTLAGYAGGVRAIAISPDGQTIAGASNDKTIKLWNLREKELLFTLTGHGDRVRSVAISPDSQILASGGNDKTIKLWNLNTGELIQTLTDHTAPVTAVTISNNGQVLVSSSDDCSIKVWNLTTGELLHSFTEHKNYTVAVAISPDGRTIASGSFDNTIKLWRVAS